MPDDVSRDQWFNNNQVSVGYYCVCFLDFLGQKSELQNLRDAKDSSVDRETEMRRMMHLGADLQIFRELATNLIDRIDHPSDLADTLSPSDRERLIRLKKADIRMNFFSDSTVLTVKLAAIEKQRPVMSIFTLIEAVSTLLVTSLIDGVPIRGGIDIGFGVPLTENEVYGTSLARAYKLESVTARWPRIAVGSELISYLNDQLSGAMGNDDESRMCRKFAQESLSRIVDWKGEKMIDFLDDTQKEVLQQKPEILAKLVSNVLSQKNSAPDKDIRTKYEELIEYWESRMPGVFFEPLEDGAPLVR